MTHKHTPYDIDRAIRLGVHWQDYTPAELYVMRANQIRDNRNVFYAFWACIAAFAGMISYLYIYLPST